MHRCNIFTHIWHPLSFYYFFYIFCFKYILTTVSPPSKPPSLSQISSSSSSSISPQKIADFPRISTEQDRTRYNQTRQKPSSKGWAKEPTRRKRVSKAGRRVRGNPNSHWVEHQAKEPCHLCRWLNPDPCKLRDPCSGLWAAVNPVYLIMWPEFLWCPPPLGLL